MKKSVLLTIILMLLMVGCRKKTYDPVTIFASSEAIMWDNPSSYDGFEVWLDDEVFDTKDTYILPTKNVENVTIKPYIKLLRKNFKQETKTSMHLLDESKSLHLTLTSQKKDIAIPSTIDVVYLSSNPPTESTLFIQKREHPIKIIFDNVFVVAKDAFIHFEAGSYKGLIIESLDDENKITIDKKSAISLEGLSVLDATYVYRRGSAPLHLIAGRGGDGRKGADADFISHGRAGKQGSMGGLGIKGGLVLINTTSSIHIKPGIGGAGGLGGTAGWYAFLAKRDGKQGPPGERGLFINYALSYTLINGEIIELE